MANPHDLGLAPSRLPAAVQWLFVALVAVGVAVSGAYAVMEHWRRATFILGAALLWLSVVRLTCDSQRLGVLAVRSRKFDAFYTAIAGGALVYLSSSVDALGS